MSSIELTRAGHLAEITINRPDALNALDVEAVTLLRDHLIACRDDDGVRAILLTGAGQKSFCVGTDLKKSTPTDTSYAEMMVRADDASVKAGNYVRYMMFHHLQLWKPVVAAVNGYCVGGGMELALQCDLRVASSNASFGLPEAKVGSFPGVGGVPMLLRKLPPAIAMKLMMTGDRIDAAEAMRHGFVSDVWSPDELMPRARELAQRICDCGPLAVAAIKKLAHESEGLPVDAAFSLTETYFGLLKNSADRIEGRRAFAEKRKPRFSGR
ncbi:enoyl-CoA hydratase/isomerase family protein [Ramlibacter sp.]|uniref:enoyl-CoA hydratase/isomerase family protein n=1 Tax=Ramlibacter sp. TaxID=1917967 RepID=UPI003D110423